MQLKRRFRGRVFLILFLIGSGCAPGRPQPPPPPPHTGAVVRVACPDQARARLIESHCRSWQTRQQARVEVVRFDPREGPDQAGPSDVWLLPAGDLAHWIDRGRLLPVPEELTSISSVRRWTSLLPLYRDRLLVWDGTVFAMPLIGDAPICCYRRDRFEGPAHQAAFQQQEKAPLRPPLTWADFERQARYFAQAGRPSLPPLPADDDDLDREFHALAAAYACRAVPEEENVAPTQRDAVFSFHYDLETGKPRIASPGFVHALKLLQRLQKYRPEAAGSAVEAFRRGEAVLCLGETWAVADFQRGKDSAVRDRFGVCQVPGGEGYFATTGTMQLAPSGVNAMPYLGTRAWLAVVPRSSANPDAAFDLLADLSGRETSNEVLLDLSLGTRWAGGPIRQDQLEDRTRWDAFDLDQACTTELKETLRQTLIHRGLKNPVLCLRTPTSREHRQLLLRAVRQAVLTGGDAQEALSRVAEQWDQLDQKRGLDKVRADYRISLGLLGR